MPIIHVEMFEGRTVEQKRELVQVLTHETARIVRCEPAVGGDPVRHELDQQLSLDNLS